MTDPVAVDLGVPGFGIAAVREAAARLAGRAVRTPLLNSPLLDEQVGARVFVKAECLQLTGSFKFRGALSTVLSLTSGQRASGVVTYSAGNHGQGVAAAARLVGCPVTVVMPSTAPQIKIDNCRWWGADTVFYDPETENREDIAGAIASERGMTVIPPFDDPRVMAGQGTVGLEIAEQLREQNLAPDTVLVNCSGGGLASGVITALNHEFAGLDNHIVEPAGFDKMARSLASGQVCGNPRPPSRIMDAIGGPTAGARTLAVLSHYDVNGLTVTDAEALAAVKLAHTTLKIVLEPGAAASLAALLFGKIDVRGRIVVTVGSGGNVDPQIYERAITA